MHVCAADVGSTDQCLIRTESQQTGAIKNRRGRKLYISRIDELEVREKQREFQEEMTKNAERFSELLESISTSQNDTERDSAGDRIKEGWEQVVNNTASKVIGKKLITCSRAVKWWSEGAKETTRVSREAYTRYRSSKMTAGSDEHATDRNKLKEMVEKKKGLWKDAIDKTTNTLMTG